MTVKKKQPQGRPKQKASPNKSKSGGDDTAQQFIRRLELFRSSAATKGNLKAEKDGYDPSDVFMGARMGEVFGLAKEFVGMPVAEISKLLDSPVHEVRVGAVSIMDFQARKKPTPETRKALFDLYIQRHDRINHWGMVDRAAPYVVGGYLADKSRIILDKLARSKNVWERRTAIVSTYYFIRQGEIDDTFRIAEMLVNDKHHFIHTAVGGWVREAGKKDLKRLLAFLDKHATTLPRIALRFAIEHLDKKKREYYLGVKPG